MSQELRVAFLANHQRYQRVLEPDMGWVPATERGRLEGFGDYLTHWRPARLAQAEALLTQEGDHALPPLALLAAAWQNTGDTRFPAAAWRRYQRWLVAHPSATITAYNASRSIDLAHGLYAFLGPLHLFLSSPVFTDEVLATIIASARAQLAHLHDHLYPARNLRITSASSLCRNGLRLAFEPAGLAWFRRGAEVMRDACLRQIMPDGSHWEATPHYHHCTMGDLLHYYRIISLMPELGYRVPPVQMASLYDYLTAATRPSGWVTGLHDGPSAPTSGIHGAGVGETLAERRGYRQWLGLDPAPLPLAQHYPHAGQVFLRDSWQPDATWWSFNAAPCRGYHWHASANGLELEHGGRLLLGDPGRFSYGDPVWRGLGYPTANHSTLNLNGWNQTDSTCRLRHLSGPDCQAVQGTYDGGYWPGTRDTGLGAGILATHQRLFLWWQGHCAVVLDQLFCPAGDDRKPALELVWQFTPGPLTQDADTWRIHTEHADANVLLLMPLRPAGAVLRRFEGETQPRRAWMPVVFEKDYAPAPQAVLSVPRLEPWNSTVASILLPYRGGTVPALRAETLVDPDQTGTFYAPATGHLRLHWGDGRTDDLYWTRRLESAVAQTAEWQSDASLVWLRRDASGQVRAALAIDGSYLAPWLPHPLPTPGVLRWGELR